MSFHFCFSLFSCNIGVNRKDAGKLRKFSTLEKQDFPLLPFTSSLLPHTLIAFAKSLLKQAVFTRSSIKVKLRVSVLAVLPFFSMISSLSVDAMSMQNSWTCPDTGKY